MAKFKEYQSNHNCEKELNDLIRNNDFSNFEIGIKNQDDQLNLVASEKISANETFFKIPLWQTVIDIFEIIFYLIHFFNLCFSFNAMHNVNLKFNFLFH